MRLGAVSAGFQQSCTPILHHSLPKYGADGETRTLVGRIARQFTKLLLSLLSHAGLQNVEFRMRNEQTPWKNATPSPFRTPHSALCT